jgi:L-histidine N-alpha-methyltransferase
MEFKEYYVTNCEVQLVDNNKTAILAHIGE